ncbi:MAG: tRNA (adenosine(37)-N6)-threonylcarbamoyltransferase complex ATPase subunit type 1 TsaE [Candidatus Peregrinibacteria bacterium]
MTTLAGASLAHSLYSKPLTLWLMGELGAGKTTFLRGFAQALGVRGRITSPTFALEQRYPTTLWDELLHLDLYRLTESQAIELVRSSEDHEGIRCIEWAERLPDTKKEGGIHLHFTDEGTGGRTLTIDFQDQPIPSEKDIRIWRQQFSLSHIIVRHCEAVAKTARALAQSMIARGIIVREQSLFIAASAHDLLRFLDFSKGAGHQEEEVNEERARIWQETQRRYPDLRHEEACARFLESEGYPMVATIMRTHGLTMGTEKRTTIEQQILYYADKRVKLDEVVSLEERLRDFTERYGKGEESHQSTEWYDEARELEKELFPGGAPL